LLNIAVPITDYEKAFKYLKIMDLVKFAEDTLIEKQQYPDFKAGDTVTVVYRIKEGNKER
jgi:ribosomal protein L19